MRCRAHPCGGIRQPAAAATKVIHAATAEHSAALKFRVICALDIFGIALGVADWVSVQRNSDKFPQSVKPARRGMAEDIDVAQAEAQPAQGSVLDHLPMRDEEGQLASRVCRRDHARHPRRRPAAVVRGGGGTSRGRSRRSDRGPRTRRPRHARRTDRHRFRLLGAERGRRRRPRGNPRGTRAGDGRGGRSRTGIRRRRRTARRPRRGGPGRDPRKAAAVRARAAGAQPALSGKLRRPADAVRVHRGAAGLDRRPGDRLHARHPRSAGPVLRDLRGRFRKALAGRRRRWTRCCGRAGRCRSPT